MYGVWLLCIQCPAGKPLVQHMRLAKATIREKEAKK